MSAQEEIDRVLPVVEELVKCSDVPVSIDTYKATVAAHALSAGASIVNDISGFAFDHAMASTVAAANASAVVMHIKGTPGTMQANPTYADLFGEILSYLRTAVRKGEDCGIRQMIVDPGIGFGKTPAHNFSLLAGVGRFASLGYPLMVGPSRKSFLAAAIDLPVEERMEASLAAATAAVISGAHLLRVHDVRATKRAVAVADAIRGARH